MGADKQYTKQNVIGLLSQTYIQQSQSISFITLTNM